MDIRSFSKYFTGREIRWVEIAKIKRAIIYKLWRALFFPFLILFYLKELRRSEIFLIISFIPDMALAV